jgi:hypothetical protein
MSSSDGSSDASTSSVDEDAVFEFRFSLENDIQDVIRFGTLGQFQKTQPLVNGSLKPLDYVFPVAIEVMRLMYDQGDFAALHAYTIGLGRHVNWTPKALCILHLMHDVSGALCGKSAKVATTSKDLFAARLDVPKVSDLDEEQVKSEISLRFSASELTEARYS